MKTNVLKTWAMIVSSVLCYSIAYTQNVGISASGAAPSGDAGLDVNFTDKGLLIPRVSLTNTGTYGLSGGGPTNSMLVFNTNAGIAGTGAAGVGYYYWSTTAGRWVKLLAATNPSDAWLITGNAGTTAGTHFVGTTDNVDLVFKTNNTERMRIKNNGWIGVFTSTPSYIFQVVSASTAANTAMAEFENNSSNGVCTSILMNSTANAFNSLEGITNYVGTTYAPSAIFGLAISSTNANYANGVRGWMNGRDGYGVWGARVTSVGTIGQGGMFQGGLGYTGGLNNFSDERLKKNIKKINEVVNVLDAIKKLKVVAYYFDTEKYPYFGFSDKLQFGFIAQDLEKYFPNIVSDSKLGEVKPITQSNQANEVKFHMFKSYDVTQILPLLAEAIKEQQQQIEQLQAELKQLKENKNK